MRIFFKTGIKQMSIVIITQDARANSFERTLGKKCLCFSLKPLADQFERISVLHWNRDRHWKPVSNIIKLLSLMQSQNKTATCCDPSSSALCKLRIINETKGFYNIHPSLCEGTSCRLCGTLMFPWRGELKPSFGMSVEVKRCHTQSKT